MSGASPSSAKGEPTAPLARDLQLSRTRVHDLPKKVHTNLADALERGVLEDEVLFECDEVYINAGESRRPAHRPRRSPQTAGQ